MPHYSDKQIEAGLVAAKGMVYVAAAKMGCSPNTIKARLAKNTKGGAHLRDVLAAESELVNDTAELKLHEAILAGSPWAIQYRLTRCAKDRGYGEAIDLQHGGVVGLTVMDVLLGGGKWDMTLEDQEAGDQASKVNGHGPGGFLPTGDSA